MQPARKAYRLLGALVLLPCIGYRLAAQTGPGKQAVPQEAGVEGIAMLVMALVPFLLAAVVLGIVVRAHIRRRQAVADRLMLNDPARWN